MKFDLISDVHLEDLVLDSYEEKTIPQLVKEILPSHPSSVLVFAGDFGFYNYQNLEFIKELKKTYPYILYVYGNNDIKVHYKHNIEQFDDAKQRVRSFEEAVKKIEGVYHLDGTTVEIDGITYGGSNIFYDYDDLIKQFAFSEKEIEAFWKRQKLHLKHKGYIDNPKEFAEQEKEKLRKVIEKSDVIVTHGSPDYFVTKDDVIPGFYRFDGQEFEKKIANKVWCYGHRHERMINVKYEGCRFYNATYVGERQPKIITITIKKG